jgi:GTP-binding protein
MAESSGKDPLIIRSMEFIGGMIEPNGWRPPADLPEIAFSGRSNVGKSSLLNTLLRRRAFARVSKTPGRTREINFFKINNAFTLVDLPGYGYAKVSKERKEVWGGLIDDYLRNSPALRGVVQLLDIRRDPSDDDKQMLDFLAELERPTIVTLTKADKLSKSAVAERASKIARQLLLDPEQVIVFSSHTGQGRDELAEAVSSLMTQ